jgi:glucose-6-phosphate isomerase
MRAGSGGSIASESGGFGGKVESVIDRLRRENMVGQMEAASGRSFAEVASTGSRFAALGFDGGRNRMGWTVSAVKRILGDGAMLGEVAAQASDIAERFRHVIFCGMGGSGLGVEVASSTFGTRGPAIHSLRTTDRAVLKALVDSLAGKDGSLKSALDGTLVVAVSKSGTTAETLSHKDFFERLFRSQGVDPRGHVMLLTDPGSPMVCEAAEKGYMISEIQLGGGTDVGGRFTSPATRVFLLPAALCDPEAAGKRMERILRQAQRMNDWADIRQDGFVRLGASLYLLASEYGRDKLTFLVPDGFRSLPNWVEQLFEESLGKGGKGITVFHGERLTPDALKPRDECDRVFVRINMGDDRPGGELWERLKAGGYPAYEIEAEEAESVGGIMLGLERAVATIGYLWGICFVDQPGVEAYKRETKSVMAEAEAVMKTMAVLRSAPETVARLREAGLSGSRPDAESAYADSARLLLEEAKSRGGGRVGVPREWQGQSASHGSLRLYYRPFLDASASSADALSGIVASMGGRMDDAIAVYAGIVKMAAAWEGFGAAEIGSYGRMTPGVREALEAAREDIYTKGLMVPCKLGEGPDKNHSYQQNLQDGRNSFFSTYVTYAGVPAIREAEYDENLLAAPTIGTVKSMTAAGRRCVLIVADGTADEAAADISGLFRGAAARLRESRVIR